MALALLDQRRFAEGNRQLDEGIDFCRRNVPDNVLLAYFIAHKGFELRRQKKYQAAIRAFQEALEVTRRLEAEENDGFFPVYGLGLTSLDLGRVDEAILHLERALTLRPENLVAEPELRAGAAFGLARALTAKGRDRRRACDLAGEALVIYRKAMPREKRLHLSETERWLARYGCTPDV